MGLPSEDKLLHLKDARNMDALRYASEKWYGATYLAPDGKAAIEQPPLRWGQMYTFGYDPKYADKLSFYDNRPIILALGRKQGSDPPLELGLNLAFIPPVIREAILDKVFKVYSHLYDKQNYLREVQKEPNAADAVPFGYYIAKDILDGSGFEYSIRSYLMGHVMTPFKFIPQTDWWRTTLFSSQFIVKQNKWWIYYRYKLNRDSSYRVGTKEKKLDL